MLGRRGRLVLAALAAVALSAAASAEPAISIVVGYTAGGTTDTMARVIGPRLAEKLGRTVIVDDRPGAAAQIASRIVAKASPDGNTLQLATQTSHAAGQRLSANPGYDPVKDFTPIGLVAYTPLVLVANVSTGIKSFQELIDYVRARPGQINFATGGYGDGSDLATVMFNSAASLTAVRVPYQGDGAAMPAVLGGHVPFMFVSAPTAMSGIATGQVRPLAVTGKTRFSGLPDVPTVAETGLANYEVVLWWGMFGPAGMDGEAVKKLNATINEILKEPDTSKRLGELGYEITTSSSDEFADYVKSENVKWAKILQAQGLTK
jgi:tripartite-type tricarboxylate transporter receptor subunit TctC